MGALNKDLCNVEPMRSICIRRIFAKSYNPSTGRKKVQKGLVEEGAKPRRGYKNVDTTVFELSAVSIEAQTDEEKGHF